MNRETLLVAHVAGTTALVAGPAVGLVLLYSVDWGSVPPLALALLLFGAVALTAALRRRTSQRTARFSSDERERPAVNDDRFLVVVVAALALLSFGIGAANVDGVVDAERNPMEAGDSVEGDGEMPDREATDETCLIGCAGARSLLDGALAGVSRRVLALAGVGAAVAFAVLFRFARGRGDEAEAGDRSDRGDDPPETAVRATAFAADDARATNEVYRAWNELAERVDGDGAGTTTAAEYADLARRRGYDETAVETLTEVFRRVRYGQESATDERERRAKRAVEAVLEERES